MMDIPFRLLLIANGIARLGGYL